MLMIAFFLVVLSNAPTARCAGMPSVDPQARQILKNMCDHLGGLQQFSVHTQNTLEDVLYRSYRVDFEIAAEVVVSRPNQLRAERKGDRVDQIFTYDGKTVTLYNPSEKVYASKPAPGTIEAMFDFARESLGLMIPVADLVYRNAFVLLMQDVDMAVVVGKSVIGGVSCDHLLFSRPGVDFQVWVADKGAPLPYKYVVTDTGTPQRLSISTVMSDWDAAPAVASGRFTFVPPKNATAIEFMPF
jgi:hypothetical protein